MYKKARGKINLSLNVLEKRSDGYHNIESVFQKISIYDEIYVTKTDEEYGINIVPEITGVKLENNIIYKAYELLKNNFRQIKGVEVVLKKNIPMKAGLGGGSTDCGAFLECMNELFNLNLSKNQMIDIGKELGADVPASLYNRPIIAKGIGEEIEEINVNFKYYILIVKPKFALSTKEMYKKLDSKEEIIQKYNTQKIRNTLENKDIEGISKNLYNVFENAVDDIEEIKKELINVGAIGSLMSGAGSCIFGIFENKTKAKLGYQVLKNKYETYYCKSYSK